MMRTTAFLIGASLLAGTAQAQITPLPDDQTGAHMVRAAGMPLNDGALPPGMLTVRVVEGGFTRDLADQPVTITVEGGESQSARTGADGRAQFAHLPIGARVRTSAVVGAERLESNPFEMTAASGVRILLVAGAAGAPGAIAPSANPSWTLAPPPPSAAPVSSEPVRNDDPSDGVGVTAIRAVLATATVFALTMVWTGRRPRRTS